MIFWYTVSDTMSHMMSGSFRLVWSCELSSSRFKRSESLAFHSHFSLVSGESMVNFCSVGGCSGRPVDGETFESSTFVHALPSIKARALQRKKWVDFISSTRASFHPSANSGVCSKHFTRDSYSNIMQFEHNIRKNQKTLIHLHPNAIPTIRPASQVVNEPTAAVATRKKKLKISMDKQYLEDVVAQYDDDEACVQLVSDEESESESEEQYEMIEEELSNDPEWIPGYKVNEEEDIEETTIANGKWCDVDTMKVITDIQKILDLLLYCRKCGAGKETINCKQITQGSIMKFSMRCDQCSNSWSWQSVGTSRADAAAENTALAGSILYTGSQPQKTIDLMKANKIKYISKSYFFHNQNRYYAPIIKTLWEEERAVHLQQTKEKEQVILGGDARCDSMGYCAQFSSYTIMDLSTNKILDIQNVSRVETSNSSPLMEKEGLTRCLRSLHDDGITPTALITDQHSQITKMLKDNYDHIKHYFDVWHVAKGTRKKLKGLLSSAVNNSGELTRERVDSFINRLYYMAKSTSVSDHREEELEEKRKAMLDHAVGICAFPENSFYENCGHGTLQRERLDPEGDVYKRLKGIFNTPMRKKAICKLSPFGQTSNIESYHHIVLSYAPKNLSFGYVGMTSRLLLAGLHYNENSNRDIIRNSDGSSKTTVRYIKYMGGKGTVSIQKEKITKVFVKELMERTYVAALNRLDCGAAHAEIPITMTAALEREDPAAVRERHSSRFNKDVFL